MRLRNKPAQAAPDAVQLRSAGRQPFGALDAYVPLKNGEIALYRAIRGRFRWWMRRS